MQHKKHRYETHMATVCTNRNIFEKWWLSFHVSGVPCRWCQYMYIYIHVLFLSTACMQLKQQKIKYSYSHINIYIYIHKYIICIYICLYRLSIYMCVVVWPEKGAGLSVYCGYACATYVLLCPRPPLPFLARLIDQYPYPCTRTSLPIWEKPPAKTNRK